MMVWPGLSWPVRTASRIILSAARSFTEPPGLKPSSLARTLTPGDRPRAILLISTSGVLPMIPVTVSTFASSRVAGGAGFGIAVSIKDREAARGYIPPAIAGTMDMLSPSFNVVSTFLRKRMSSPFT